MGEDLEQLKQRLPLLDYLRQQNWVARPASHGCEFVGLCPLHPETRPSFYVNTRKNLFYCHGCGQGGDLIRFVELSQRLSFRQSLAYLERQKASPAETADVLEQAAAFYQRQLRHYPEARRYLEQRGLRDPALIEELRIGYAPGGNLRRHFTDQGYSWVSLQRAGLVNPQGCDAFYRRVVFPCCQDRQVVNLYGRSIGAAFPHRFLPGPRGGLFAWESVRQFSTVILVEGLFDVAVLWQAGFRNATCAFGTQLTPLQFCQLSAPPGRCVYLAFDQDENQAGPKASRALARQLQRAGRAVFDGPVACRPGSQQLLRWRRPGCRFHFLPPRSPAVMRISVVHQPAVPASSSPYRLQDENERELDWANAFLDAQRLRQLSLRSLRAYAYDLLDFARWFELQRRPLAEMTERTLVDYVRHQLDQHPKPTPPTVNHRLGVLRCCYRFHSGQDIPAGPVHFQRGYTQRSPLGYGRPRRAIALGLRLKPDRRVIRPLSAEEVAKFWQSFRNYRDLGLVGLMLLDGLRSCEVLGLELEDFQLADGQMRVHGKGNKKRVVPLPPEILETLGNYLRLERPLTNSPALFVSLKGRQRGQPMTAAGLRSLFRHHRVRSRIPHANPHRLRHTCGADLVRAGMSLPALQHLLGHAQIRTTMLYVQLAPQDVWREYERALQRQKRLDASHLS